MSFAATKLLLAAASLIVVVSVVPAEVASPALFTILAVGVVAALGALTASICRTPAPVASRTLRNSRR